MTLGLTSSGAIKIKTDGGTTRAVECACCGGCGCVTITDPVLADLLAAATFGTVPMSSPAVFTYYTANSTGYREGQPGWHALFMGSNVYNVDYYTLTKQFCMNGDNAANLISSGAGCPCDSEIFESCTETVFKINGNSFPATSFIFQGGWGGPVAPPAFTFS
jgi:hypothetical protein